MDDLETLTETVDRLKRRVAVLEERIAYLEGERDHGTGSTVSTPFTRTGVDLSCPSCGDPSAVTTAVEAASILEESGELTGKLIETLSGETHACVDCRESFTP